MEKTPNILDDWKFVQELEPDKRVINVSIHLKDPDIEEVIKVSIENRIEFRNSYFNNQFERLLTKLENRDYVLIGTKKLPRGVKTELYLSELDSFKSLSFVGSVFIENVQGAKKISVRSRRKEFFCVKMTVSIQIEGVEIGMQTFEERFVLVKAKDFDEAYEKAQKNESEYEKPYLNSDYRLVRWKVESYDDCYSSGISDIKDLNDEKGVEIFSILKQRKLNKERISRI